MPKPLKAAIIVVVFPIVFMLAVGDFVSIVGRTRGVVLDYGLMLTLGLILVAGVVAFVLLYRRGRSKWVVVIITLLALVLYTGHAFQLGHERQKAKQDPGYGVTVVDG